VTAAVTQALSPAEVVLAYHARTKHRLERYAAGPETLDWDTQPNPFREFAGCPRTPLPLVADQLGTSFAQVYSPGSVVPAPPTIASVSALMELSMGLSAWKEYGPDRWALRCNPSSGNLHPTEAYIFSSNVSGLDDGLHHYLSRDHALEQRCRTAGNPGGPARLRIGLSSVHWREAWKYGERAFRYCQLDIGHALGALRYAAAALGWTATVVDEFGPAALAALMGLDRAEDFTGAEREDADLLIAIDLHPEANSGGKNDIPDAWEPATTHWAGRANLLDPRPFYRWPVIDQASQATRGRGAGSRTDFPNYPPRRQPSEARAADIILGRRSAQRLDSKFTMSAEVFYRLLDGLLARPIAPWDVWSFAPRLHPIFFIHRVEGLEPGFYALPRRPDAARSLRETLRPDFAWQPVESAPAHLPFVKLLPADCLPPMDCERRMLLAQHAQRIRARRQNECVALPPAPLGSRAPRACAISGGRSCRAARNRDRLLLR
jgi:SagB-type dehydrogenase family enzyme